MSTHPHTILSLYILAVLVYPNDCGRKNLAQYCQAFSRECMMSIPYLTICLQAAKRKVTATSRTLITRTNKKSITRYNMPAA